MALIRLNKLQEKVRGYQDKLVTCGEATVASLVFTLRDDESDFVRRRAIEVLANIKDRRAVEPLIEAMQDANSEVWTSAMVALQRNNLRA